MIVPELTVVFSQESITQDDQRSELRWEVESHDGGNTAALYFENVVIGGNWEIVAIELEAHIRETVTLGTVDCVLTRPALLCTDLSVEHLSVISWHCNQRCTSVNNSTGALKFSLIFAKLDAVQLYLPVSLATNWKLDEFALVMALIDSTESGNRVCFATESKVEGEDWFIEETLLDHVVERWNHSINGDCVVSETHDTIELSKGES